jgi:hypothetical protein
LDPTTDYDERIYHLSSNLDIMYACGVGSISGVSETLIYYIDTSASALTDRFRTASIVGADLGCKGITTVDTGSGLAAYSVV